MRYKIYVGHSRDIRCDYVNELYDPLTSALNEDEVIVPHPQKAEAHINSQEILPTCHLMIAEVSYPSTGLGMELAWAKVANIPILCIHHIQCQPSSSVTHLFPDRVSYANVTEMVEKVSTWIIANEDKLHCTRSASAFRI